MRQNCVSKILTECKNFIGSARIACQCFNSASLLRTDNCRQLEFKPDHAFDGKRLEKHVIRTVEVMDGNFCETVCYMEPNCVSYNLKKAASENGRYKCELNNSTFEGQKNKLEENSKYLYRGAKVSFTSTNGFFSRVKTFEGRTETQIDKFVTKCPKQGLKEREL